MKITRILSPAELSQVIEALERLAACYDALGIPEDAKLYRALATKLKGGAV